MSFLRPASCVLRPAFCTSRIYVYKADDPVLQYIIYKTFIIYLLVIGLNSHPGAKVLVFGSCLLFTYIKQMILYCNIKFTKHTFITS